MNAIVVLSEESGLVTSTFILELSEGKRNSFKKHLKNKSKNTFPKSYSYFSKSVHVKVKVHASYTMILSMGQE